ncbi:CCA tRNA nucleotidyltransferase [Rhodoligotrophos defluvii]|uniref:CCA tRNA nucleotidyltransferase n=1 Tax=Rhodoligotrophos defluvii TaxID=2561934 RepID=UPI0010C9B3CE|nr:CCA tRNA nucleotidyltransferase [Rhodoligotrophos defluvii]
MTPPVLSPQDHPWLRDERLQAVFDALEAESGKARVVGGAIRNALFGEPVVDVDLATTETPERVIDLGMRAGLRSVPTGVAHGTVTVIATSGDGPKAFEVTTLRRDVATDGRHAEVAFTDDWAQDAARRDFTINALYCDRHGKIYDPLSIYEDLLKKRIRFVGDPIARVREDYLRILRLFRFAARYGPDGIDPASLSACAAEQQGLARLSPERVRQEWLRLIVAPWSLPVAGTMGELGILAHFLGPVISVERLKRLGKIESFLGLEPDFLLRSFNLAGGDSALVMRLRDRLRLTNDERERLERLVAAGPVTPGLRPNERRAVLYRLGPQTFRDAVLTAWCGGNRPTEDEVWRELFLLPEQWPIPSFPLRGSDLLERGIKPGPEFGGLLRALEDWWIASDFAESRDELLARIGALRQG